jgi:hypothetical protein
MPKSNTCRVCGAENPPGRLFCVACGKYLQSEDEDTWVDLPPIPAGSGAGPPTPSLTSQSPPPPPPPPPPPQQTAEWGHLEPVDAPPVEPPRRRHRWLLALILATLLFVTLAAVAAVVYRSLSTPDEPGFADTVNTTVPTTGTGSAVSTTTTETPVSSTTDTTQGGSSTTQTSPGPSERPLEIASPEASSTLPPAGSNSYGVTNLLDGDLATCWAEGVSGDGVGESVRLGLSQPTTLSKIEIANGYQKDERRFLGNPRIKLLRVEFSDGTATEFNLHDDVGFQSITPPDLPVDWVEFTIGSTYPGNTWEDTSVSEIRLYGAQ